MFTNRFKHSYSVTCVEFYRVNLIESHISESTYCEFVVTRGDVDGHTQPFVSLVMIKEFHYTVICSRSLHVT